MYEKFNLKQRQARNQEYTLNLIPWPQRIKIKAGADADDEAGQASHGCCSLMDRSRAYLAMDHADDRLVRCAQGMFSQVLVCDDGRSVEAKYILTSVLWKYLYRYAKKHQARGNGFGYGMVYPNNPQSVTRTLSARYYKDGAEILIDRGWDMATGEKDFDDPLNQQHRPRRLTPRECARLMGFEAPGEAKFRIPVSDTQAYRQFGNSVVVPVFAAVAKLLEPKIKQAVALRQQEAQHGRRSR